MTDEITVHGGIRGTRILAAAFATLALRKRGIVEKRDGRATIPLKKYIATWGKRAGRPWLPEELKRAKEMIARGYSPVEIGKVLNRSRAAVYHKVGAGLRAKNMYQAA